MGTVINILILGLVLLVSVLSVILIWEQNRLRHTAASLKGSYRRFGRVMDKLETFVEGRAVATSPTMLSDIEIADAEFVAARRPRTFSRRQNPGVLTPWMSTRMPYSGNVARPNFAPDSFCPFCHGDSHKPLPETQKWLVEDYLDFAWDSGHQQEHGLKDEALVM